MIERNKELRAQLKSFFYKMLATGILCFYITYEHNLEKNEMELKEQRLDISHIYANMLSNIEFIYIKHDKQSRHTRVHIVIGVRPLTGCLMESDILYSQLNEYVMLYDKIKIKKIESLLSIDNLVGFIKNDMDVGYKETPQFFVNFSDFFKETRGCLSDFFDGNYKNTPRDIRDNKFSKVKGNFSFIFDEYSLLNLFEFFLIINNLEIRGEVIYKISTDVVYDNINFFYYKFEHFIANIYDNYSMHTNQIILNEICIRLKKKAYKLLIKKYTNTKKNCQG